MCGICGYVGIREDGLLERMTAALIHRGPDSSGYFRCEDAGLGHRRLSIIDVAGGHQPMENEDGSLVLIANGEVYNFRELREELLARGHRLRTKSDCEVILHLYEDFGPQCLQRMLGMWAFAIYDKNRRRLFLARDRLGIKPLYYVHLNGRFLFASEFKAILRYQGFQPTLNPHAVHEYLTLRYVPGPDGMFRELRKLPAGHYAIIEDGRVTLTRYWTPQLYDGPFDRSQQSYVEEFAERFERSVQRRMISEVPLGAYLSGGLDSSTIVAYMAKLVHHPLRTFTVGFEYEHDELGQAAATAKALGCQHTEIRWRASDIALLPKIIYHLDEPLGDPIVIPMYMLAAEAKKHVTVILTGEGADETLAGYLFHRALLAGYRLERVVPRWARRRLLAPALSLVPSALLNRAFEYPARLGRRGEQKIADYLDMLEPEQLADAYRHLISLFDARDTADLYTDDFRGALAAGPASDSESTLVRSHAPFLNRVLHLQFAHWLPEDILTKQDKMSMAHAVEGRVPFLDHELVEFILKVPPSLKIHHGQSKFLLREYARRYLPKQVISRRKMPFYVPMEKYAAEPVFEEMLEDTLSPRGLLSRGIVRPEAVARLRRAKQQGEFILVKQLFSLMALELWFRMAVDRRGADGPV